MHITVSNRVNFPLLITSLQSVAVILLVVCCKRKRNQKARSSHSNLTYAYNESKPTAETVTSHANPTYDGSDYKPENQSDDNEYFIPDQIGPPEWCKSQSDLAEQWYDDIGSKDLMEGFADDPIYDCLEPPQKGNHTFSFTNQSFLTSSDT